MPIGKMIDPALAASVYSNNAKIGGQNASSGSDISFSEFMKDRVADSIDTVKKGEAKSAEAVKGTANLTEVVEATTAAELTLQTFVAIRDKCIAAYQEIMRMPI